MIRKKHFIAISELIGNAINNLIMGLEIYFIEQNPNFDKKKFRDEIKKKL